MEINKLIEKIEKNNTALSQRKKELQMAAENVSMIKDIEEYITASKDERQPVFVSINDLRKSLPLNALTEEETRIMTFLTTAMKLNDDFSKEQKELCSKVIGMVKEQVSKSKEQEEIDAELDRNNKIIEKIETGTASEVIDDVLLLLQEEDIDIEEQIEVLETIGLTLFENKKEDVANLLSQYGLNFDDFTEKNQYQLLYGNTIGNIEDTLKSLQEHKIDVKRIFTKGQDYLAVLLRKSNPKIVDEIYTTIEKVGLNDGKDKRRVKPEEYIMRHITILIPNSKGRRRSTEPRDDGKPPKNKEGNIVGAKNNFEKNIAFFLSQGLDEKVIRSIPFSLLIHSPSNIKENFEYLNNQYGIKFDDDTSFSPLSNIHCIEMLDRYIEISSMALKYIQENTSLLCKSYERKIFRRMKIGEKKNLKIIYDRGAKGLVRRSNLLYNDDNWKDEYKDLEITDTPERIRVRNLRYSLGTIATEKMISETSDITLNNPDIAKLEKEHKVDEYAYEIDGIRISRNKVLRIYENFRILNVPTKQDELLFALTYNSLLSDDELKKVVGYTAYKEQEMGGKNGQSLKNRNK